MGVLDRLLDFLRRSPTWPPPGQRAVWEAIEFWAALRRSDEMVLKQHASIPWHRDLLITPVPRMMSRAKANLLYGEEMESKAPEERDQENLERIITENGLGAELHRAAMMASSEREVWGKVSVDPTLLDVPIIEFVSRRRVIPHFRGRFVEGATFVTEWEESSWTVMRLLETYEPGAVHSRLFMGTRISLGAEVDLDAYEPTRGRQETVVTGFDYPLVAFIPNTIDDPPTEGYSDYQGLEERFMALNETATIGQENMRLAGKKRALLDARYLRNGRLPSGDDIFIRHESEVTAGEGGKPMQLLEYQAGTEETVKWLDTMIDTTLNLGGTAPQLVGRNTDGEAPSGTALKLKMIHSLMEASGTGGFFDRGVKRLLRACAIIDARPTTQGGFGRSWSKPDADPTIIRGDGLPRDDMEAAQWLVLAVGAEAISLEERVKWLHPDWTEEQRDEEIKRIREQAKPKVGSMPEIPTTRPPVNPGLPAGGDPEGAGAPAGAAA